MWNERQKPSRSTELKGVFKTANTVVVAHYAGLTVAQMQILRKQARQAGTTVKVAKNRLAKIALEGTDVASHRPPAEGADRDRLFGRSGWRVQGRRRLRQGPREVRDPRRRDGQDRARSRTASRRLPSLPSLDELRAKIVGLIQAPATKIAQVVNAPAAKLARVVQAYANKSQA